MCVLFQVSFVCHVWLVVMLIVAADRQATIAGVCSLSGVICLSCLVSGSVSCSSRYTSDYCWCVFSFKCHLIVMFG